MPVPRRFTTEALVIRHLDYGEADRILTVYSPTHGKVHAIAKGVRRSRSRTAGHLDLFSRCSLLIAHGRNLGIITQAQLIEEFANLRQNLMGVGYAHYACELIDSFAPDSLPNAKLYDLLVTTLRQIAAGGSEVQLRAFELGVLDQSGYRPELHHCISCGRIIQPEGNGFSAAMGGILCPNCVMEDGKSVPITPVALKLLRNLQTNTPAVLRIQSVDNRAAVEIEHRLREYIMYRLEKRPKSISVLERMESRLAAGSPR